MSSISSSGRAECHPINRVCIGDSHVVSPSLRIAPAIIETQHFLGTFPALSSRPPIMSVSPKISLSPGTQWARGALRHPSWRVSFGCEKRVIPPPTGSALADYRYRMAAPIQNTAKIKRYLSGMNKCSYGGGAKNQNISFPIANLIGRTSRPRGKEDGVPRFSKNLWAKAHPQRLIISLQSPVLSCARSFSRCNCDVKLRYQKAGLKNGGEAKVS